MGVYGCIIQDNSRFWPRQVGAGTVHWNRKHSRSSRLRNWWGERRDKIQKPALFTKASHILNREGRAVSPKCRMNHWLISPIGHWEMVIWVPKWKQEFILLYKKKHCILQNWYHLQDVERWWFGDQSRNRTLYYFIEKITFSRTYIQGQRKFTPTEYI